MQLQQYFKQDQKNFPSSNILEEAKIDLNYMLPEDNMLQEIENENNIEYPFKKCEEEEKITLGISDGDEDLISLDNAQQQINVQLHQKSISLNMINYLDKIVKAYSVRTFFNQLCKKCIGVQIVIEKDINIKSKNSNHVQTVFQKILSEFQTLTIERLVVDKQSALTLKIRKSQIINNMLKNDKVRYTYENNDQNNFYFFWKQDNSPIFPPQPPSIISYLKRNGLFQFFFYKISQFSQCKEQNFINQMVQIYTCYFTNYIKTKIDQQFEKENSLKSEFFISNDDKIKIKNSMILHYDKQNQIQINQFKQLKSSLKFEIQSLFYFGLILQIPSIQKIEDRNKQLESLVSHFKIEFSFQINLTIKQAEFQRPIKNGLNKQEIFTVMEVIGPRNEIEQRIKNNEIEQIIQQLNIDRYIIGVEFDKRNLFLNFSSEQKFMQQSVQYKEKMNHIYNTVSQANYGNISLINQHFKFSSLQIWDNQNNFLSSKESFAIIQYILKETQILKSYRKSNKPQGLIFNSELNVNQTQFNTQEKQYDILNKQDLCSKKELNFNNFMNQVIIFIYILIQKQQGANENFQNWQNKVAQIQKVKVTINSKLHNDFIDISSTFIPQIIQQNLKLSQIWQLQNQQFQMEYQHILNQNPELIDSYGIVFFDQAKIYTKPQLIKYQTGQVYLVQICFQQQYYEDKSLEFNQIIKILPLYQILLISQ